jgi:hypothetical protein
MMAVSTMHEHVHERAGQQRKPNEEPDHMRTVLGKQQRTGNDEKSNKHQSGLGLHGHSLSRLVLMTKVILR